MIAAPRDLFEVPAPGPYLLAHSVGCLPVSARAAIDAAMLQPWADKGSDGWLDWLAAIDRFRLALAGLLATGPDLICPQPSVSIALTALLSGLPRRAGRERLLASRHAFPSIGFAMRACERLGYRLELIDGDPSDAGIWSAAIGPDVAAVVAMHVHSNSGRLSPIDEIAALARAAGAFSIVDIAQSAGILPVDPAAWGVDAAIGSCVKWLCGGPGAAFLWASQTLIDQAEPLNVGWFSHVDPFAFDIDDFRYAPDARRFWGGTPSIAPYALATAGIATITGLGVDRILADNRRLIACFAEEAGADIDMTHRGGTLCLRSGQADALAAAFQRIGCRFDRRGDILRLSFHSWNDEDEARQTGQAARGLRLALA
ncbi:aminotransferase class V-fold PLP-dependent enzyme [Rhizorhabdus dicambivorans]|uniref:Aminotransferase class V-fold PLP-dependent enzyme n=1 Tax=Rhizorhabdus dicambivorans TaxID=1850238 RepID=A0A2A4FWA6_9SPHN|nr:aminotransferase class V-fold PLP-dependent enzyme [Rhizorhabdus dicambivorans]ATE64566.1 aminotransferase class V-fold PLP-dependent enzyme [Rhizorhabdus dicambivorans]PCE41661.1 aminotransferase class V-fold PLP-dependent enzyme [Rhizorhabdus dicambivorans]